MYKRILANKNPNHWPDCQTVWTLLLGNQLIKIVNSIPSFLLLALLYLAFAWFSSFLKCLFILREREWVSGEGAERDGQRESQGGSTLSGQRPTQGSKSQTMRSCPEPKSSQMLNQLSHLGTCSLCFIFKGLVSIIYNFEKRKVNWESFIYLTVKT